jgi:hypothetical protein
MNYDPASYPAGVPNPLGVRVHAWKGGPRNEGTRYHGPIYTRPAYRLPWHETPLWGVGQETDEAVLVEASNSNLKLYAGLGAGALVGLLGGWLIWGRR